MGEIERINNVNFQACPGGRPFYIKQGGGYASYTPGMMTGAKALATITAYPAGGTGYAPGDLISVTGGGGTHGILKVRTAGGGIVSAADIIQAGGGYTAGTLATTHLTGAGDDALTFTVTVTNTGDYGAYDQVAAGAVETNDLVAITGDATNANTLSCNGATACTLVGGTAADTLTGSTAADAIFGNGGTDTVVTAVGPTSWTSRRPAPRRPPT